MAICQPSSRSHPANTLDLWLGSRALGIFKASGHADFRIGIGCSSQSASVAADGADVHTKDTLEAGSGSVECPAPRTCVLTDRNNLRRTWTRVQMPCRDSIASNSETVRFAASELFEGCAPGGSTRRPGRPGLSAGHAGPRSLCLGVRDGSGAITSDETLSDKNALGPESGPMGVLAQLLALLGWLRDRLCGRTSWGSEGHSGSIERANGSFLDCPGL
ncbi:hypothetical protein VTO73DRAFT_1364 [Trametes versicolor]